MNPEHSIALFLQLLVSARMRRRRRLKVMRFLLQSRRRNTLNLGINKQKSAVATVGTPNISTAAIIDNPASVETTIGNNNSDEDMDDTNSVNSGNSNPVGTVNAAITNSLSTEPVKILMDSVEEYSDAQFRYLFKVERSTFRFLMDLLPSKEKFSRGRPGVSNQKILLATLHLLGNSNCTFNTVAGLFGTCDGTMYTRIRTMLSRIAKLSSQFIKWPTGNEMAKCINGFNSLRGESSFPNVIGCIGTSHIAIKGPSGDNSFFNRNGYHSIILQGVCDYKGIFTDIYVGWPGSADDNRVWTSSPLFERIVEDPSVLPPDSHLLGDSAYPLEEFLMTPFRDNGGLTSKQIHYNSKLSSTRDVIEECFGLLKSRFQRLKHIIDSSDVVLIKNTIAAACVIHNICLQRQEDINWIPSACDSQQSDEVALDMDSIAGLDKREAIVEILWHSKNSHNGLQ